MKRDLGSEASRFSRASLIEKLYHPLSVIKEASHDVSVSVQERDRAHLPNPSQKYLKFSDQPIWLSLSIG
jgi:hypothetical protein